MKKVNIVLIFFFISLILVLIIPPNIPYKLPGKINNSDYIELEIVTGDSTGGPAIKSGSDKIQEYAEKMGYIKINTNEIYLSGDNTPFKAITTFSTGFPKYKYFRIYGKFENEPDEYHVLTFDVKEWYPLGKYIPIKDTVLWNSYSLIYIFYIKANISILVILICIKKLYFRKYN